jgi:quercetin dioxygenase-like cupin family protein
MQSRARFGSAVTLITLAACGLALASGTILAQQGGGDDSALPEGFEVTPVLKSGKSAGGAPFSYPQTDKPEIVTATGILEPGGRTARHQHPVPVYVYVLEGTLTIEPEGGQPREYSAGQAFIEDVNHWHQAFNRGETPTKILIVGVSEEGQPITVNAQ